MASVRLLQGEPLARHSTFHAGGRADLLVVESGAELEALAAGGDLPPIRLVLGGGSNILVADEGIDGTVLVLRAPAGTTGFSPAGADGMVELDGAWDWFAVAMGTTTADLQGLESMVGIPGTVGGAVVQSIGAYGYELRDLVVAVGAVDLATGSVVELAPADLGFAYRHSLLKVQDPPRLVVTRVALRITPGGLHRPRYAELAATLQATAIEGPGGGFRPADVARAVLALRRSKSMVYDDTDRQTWGAGSFFKNPEVSPEGFDALLAHLRLDAGAVPHWPKGEAVRLSAGWLVEQSGFRRGHRAGDVALCDRHALGIVNATGRATARQIADFAGAIRRAVREAAGVVLEPEPILVGLELPE